MLESLICYSKRKKENKHKKNPELMYTLPLLNLITLGQLK